MCRSSIAKGLVADKNVRMLTWVLAAASGAMFVTVGFSAALGKVLPALCALWLAALAALFARASKGGPTRKQELLVWALGVTGAAVTAVLAIKTPSVTLPSLAGAIVGVASVNRRRTRSS